MNNLFKAANSFENILDGCWKMLVTGVNIAKDPFHTPVLGTVSSGDCSLRTVALRRVIE